MARKAKVRLDAPSVIEDLVLPEVPEVESLRFHRIDAMLTQRELADLAGLERTTVINAELGVRRHISLRTMARIAKALGVRVEQIAEFREEWTRERARMKKEAEAHGRRAADGIAGALRDVHRAAGDEDQGA